MIPSHLTRFSGIIASALAHCAKDSEITPAQGLDHAIRFAKHRAAQAGRPLPGIYLPLRGKVILQRVEAIMQEEARQARANFHDLEDCIRELLTSTPSCTPAS